MMRDTTFYEWAVETTAIYPDGSTDIIDTNYATTVAEAFRMMAHQPPSETGATVEYRLALVRCVGNDDEWTTERSYAYVGSGKLPLQFDDCGAPIPKRFHLELVKAKAH